MQITLKKSLGQHFLKDENILRKIFSALQKHSFKRLLEIGPGAGALTKYLLQLENIDFKAIELDAEKTEYLLLHYPALQQKLLHEDFLKSSVPFNEDFIVIGN
jgi:16S rRNA (adenine1518-N6/adenine1519-N6)-dimethyltransferase